MIGEGDEFDLLFGSHKIARITFASADFPSYGGFYKLFPEVESNPDLARVLKMIRLSAANYSDLETENFEWEEEFTDLFDSDDWRLVSAGESISILCPIFHENNEIVWRDRIGPMSELNAPRRPWWKFW